MVARRPSVQHQALMAVAAVIMVAAALGSLSGFWHMSTSASAILIMSVATVLFSWLLWRFPGIALGLVALAALGGLVAYVRLPGFVAYLGLLRNQFIDFWAQMKALQFDTTFGGDLGQVFMVASGLGVAVLVMGESMRSGKAFWTLVVGTYIFGSQWAWYFDKSANYFMVFAIAAFALWIVGQAAHRDAHWAASGRRIGYKSHITTPMAWVLIAAIAAAILPTEFAPLDLGTLGNKLQETIPALKRMRGGGAGGAGRFSLKASGFAPRVGSLGGPVQLDRSPALLITAEKPVSGTVYLRGITLNNYDGETWHSDQVSAIQIPKDGTLPTNYAPDVPRDYMKLKVEHLQNLGSAVFSVLEPMGIEGLKVNFKADVDDQIWTDKALAKGTTYTVDYRQVSYSAEQINKLSPNPANGDFKTNLQLPSRLPDRVRELANSLTAGAPTPFDKAVALEQALRQLPYSLDVPASPDGRDFVDYFLFDLRRGYCTYYASAMTVLLRSLGIPSRQVWGYALPASAEYKPTGDGQVQYTVTNAQAHAWVESYFPNYGWVTFDPTPRADLPMIDRSAPLPKPADTTTSPDQTDTNDTLSPNTPKDRNLLDDPGLDAAAGGRVAASKPQRWPWVAGGAAVVVGLLWLLYRRFQAQDLIRAGESRHIVQEVWDKSSSMLFRFGLGRRPDQTAREYARSISTTWPAMGQPLEQVAEDYTAARYAPPSAMPDGEAPERARHFWEGVHELLITKYGWRKYIWRRLFGARTRQSKRGRKSGRNAST